MSILIGIKQVNSSGTFNGIDGVEGFSMSGTQFDIIKVGERDELKEYVKDLRSKEKESGEKLYKLQTEVEFSSMSEDDFDLLFYKYKSDLKLKNYKFLMILEGEIL